VTITLTPGSGDSFRGEQSSWASGPEAPLHVLVDLPAQARSLPKVVDIAFHEVWWADVNESLTLGKQMRFWFWGLSLAGVVTHSAPYLPGTLALTRPPANADRLTLWHRFRMGFVGTLFGLSTLSIAFVNLILKRLSFSPLLSTGIM
jgi:hypothetical protein